jgi:hypothetical protein
MGDVVYPTWRRTLPTVVLTVLVFGAFGAWAFAAWYGLPGMVQRDLQRPWALALDLVLLLLMIWFSALLVLAAWIAIVDFRVVASFTRGLGFVWMGWGSSACSGSSVGARSRE